MRKLKLFQVEPEGREALFIAATKYDHAAEIFVGVEIESGRELGSFSIERVDNKLPPEDHLGLEDMLKHGIAGIAVLDSLFGWIVTYAA